MTFIAMADADDGLLGRIASAAAESPFNTAAYAHASARLGATVCGFLQEEEDGTHAGCIALLRSRYAYRRLEIPSAPSPAHPPSFWEGVMNFCRRERITELVVDTFASRYAALPDFSRRLESRRRLEYVLDLECPDLEAGLSKNHRRNIRKASRAGVTVTNSRDPSDCLDHVALMNVSLTRRRARGESVDVAVDVKEYQTLLDARAGELYQARLDGKLLSSILVLQSANAGYYQTAGTLPEGMSIGASPFLVHEIAAGLARKKCRWFNLGGADLDADGLRRFKLGFGTAELALEAARYSLVAAPHRLGVRLHARLMNKARGLLSRNNK